MSISDLSDDDDLEDEGGSKKSKGQDLLSSIQSQLPFLGRNVHFWIFAFLEGTLTVTVTVTVVVTVAVVVSVAVTVTVDIDGDSDIDGDRDGDSGGADGRRACLVKK